MRARHLALASWSAGGGAHHNSPAVPSPRRQEPRKIILLKNHSDAAIRRAGLEGKRRTNPVVDGQLVPKSRKAKGHGPKALRKRRREEQAAATPSPRARRR